MDNAKVITQLETINFYVSESEQIRDNLQVTEAEHFPKKIEYLVRKYKECVKRILLECKMILKRLEKEPYGAFSLTPEQKEAIEKVETIQQIYSEINVKINQSPI